MKSRGSAKAAEETTDERIEDRWQAPTLLQTHIATAVGFMAFADLSTRSRKR